MRQRQGREGEESPDDSGGVVSERRRAGTETRAEVGFRIVLERVLGGYVSFRRRYEGGRVRWGTNCHSIPCASEVNPEGLVER